MAVMTKGGACQTGRYAVGTIYHEVPGGSIGSFEKALCGAAPGAKGFGWNEPEAPDQGVTCPKCLKHMGLAAVTSLTGKIFKLNLVS